MSPKMRTVVWPIAGLLGAYVPFWWVLVFSGYYDDKASADTINYMKSFVLSDMFLFGLAVTMIAGLRRKRPWAYVAGLSLCGTVFYMDIHGIHAILVGTFPRDIATQLLYWPYLLFLPFGAATLYRQMTAPPNRK